MSRVAESIARNLWRVFVDSLMYELKEK